MTPEGILKAQVVATLNAMGVFYLRIQSGKVRVKGGFMQLAPEGTADFLIFPDGRVLWCELKAPGQKTAKDRAIRQLEFRDRVLSAGHEHIHAHGIDEVVAAIRGC